MNPKLVVAGLTAVAAGVASVVFSTPCDRETIKIGKPITGNKTGYRPKPVNNPVVSSIIDFPVIRDQRNMVQASATEEGDFVLSFVNALDGVFPMVIGASEFPRFIAALDKGLEWCKKLQEAAVEGEKTIDEWEWQGRPVKFGATVDKCTQKISLHVKSTEKGRYCSIGVVCEMGLGQSSKVYIKDYYISTLKSFIEEVPQAVASLQAKATHVERVLAGLK